VPPLPAGAEKASTRERFEEHRLEGVCGRCHKMMDDIGFAFEHFDAVGRFRKEDGGKPVDDSAIVYFEDGRAEVELENRDALIGYLAESDDVRRCVVRQWFRYALGRQILASDQPSLDRAYARFRASGDDLRALIVALTTTPAFLGAAP
jgi:hypothetical protein